MQPIIAQLVNTKAADAPFWPRIIAARLENTKCECIYIYIYVCTSTNLYAEKSKCQCCVVDFFVKLICGTISFTHSQQQRSQMRSEKLIITYLQCHREVKPTPALKWQWQQTANKQLTLQRWQQRKTTAMQWVQVDGRRQRMVCDIYTDWWLVIAVCRYTVPVAGVTLCGMWVCVCVCVCVLAALPVEFTCQML